MLCWKSSQKFVSNSLFFFSVKISRKLDIKGCHPLPPGVRQEKGTREFRFGSDSILCIVVFMDNYNFYS